MYTKAEYYIVYSKPRIYSKVGKGAKLKGRSSVGLGTAYDTNIYPFYPQQQVLQDYQDIKMRGSPWGDS